MKSFFSKRKAVDVLFWACIEPNKRGSFEDFILCLHQESLLHGIKIKFVFANTTNVLLKSIEEGGIDYISADLSNIDSLIFMASLLRRIHAKTIHFHFIGVGSPLISICRFLGIKNIVLTDHNSSFPAPKCNNALNYLKTKKINLHLRNIDSIVAVSDFVARRYQVNYRTSGKVTRIYNGVDLKRFSPLTEQASKEKLKKELLQVEEDDVVITYAGQFILEKGVGLYLQVVEKLLSVNKNLCFVFVGQGPIYDEASRMILKKNMGKLRFLGVRDDMEKILRASDIAVVPSLWEEAFGLVAAEASACGVSLVASDIGGLPEVVIDGQSGILVPPGDAEALLNGIERLIHNSDERKRMGLNGRKHVEMYFDLHRRVEDLIGLYKTYAIQGAK